LQDLLVNLTYEASPKLPAGTQMSMAVYEVAGIEAFAQELATKKVRGETLGVDLSPAPPASDSDPGVLFVC
jgi:hypothetical protein